MLAVLLFGLCTMRLGKQNLYFAGLVFVDVSIVIFVVDTECWKQGFIKGGATIGATSSGLQVDIMRNLNSASSLDTPGISYVPTHADRLSQVMQSNTLSSFCNFLITHRKELRSPEETVVM